MLFSTAEGFKLVFALVSASDCDGIVCSASATPGISPQSLGLRFQLTKREKLLDVYRAAKAKKQFHFLGHGLHAERLGEQGIKALGLGLLR